MSSSTSSRSSLESSEESLDSVAVRLEDVQPRDRSGSYSPEEEVLETCFVDSIDYENDCLLNDDESSNIGSMVSIQSEDVTETEASSNSGELIVPESLEPFDEIPMDIIKTEEVEVKEEPKPNGPASWPTLEILPGGVIKNAEPYAFGQKSEQRKKKSDMMYACAKCSQSFQYLFSLVKHVKLHDDEKKFQDNLHSNKLNNNVDDKRVYVMLPPKNKKKFVKPQIPAQKKTKIIRKKAVIILE